MKTEVKITVMWLRRIGLKTQMLAEVKGKWVLIAEVPFDSNFGHIVEGIGILNAPIDKETE